MSLIVSSNGISYMPIFEYICKECDSTFEKLVMGSAELECPACHSKQLDQKFSVFSPSVPQSSGGRSPMPSGGCCGGGACGMPGPCDN